MKYRYSNYYVGKKDKQYLLNPTKNNVIRLPEETTSSRTQYEFQNTTQIRKNQKIVRTIGRSEAKIYPKKKQPIIQQPKFILFSCPSCKRNSSLEFDKLWFVKTVNLLIKNRSIKLTKKVLGQDQYFSTRLPYARTKGEKFYILW